jgi:hypothetical protein
MELSLSDCGHGGVATGSPYNSVRFTRQRALGSKGRCSTHHLTAVLLLYSCRKNPILRDRVFTGLLVFGLAHGAYMMSIADE